MNRTINGQPYAFTPIAGGFQVTSLARRTDRFHRTYKVAVENGKPMRCSCPDCFHRSNWCKHLREVEKILRGE